MPDIVEPNPQTENNEVARPPQEDSRGVRGWLAGKYNRVRRTVTSPAIQSSQSHLLQEIRELAATPTDINEHLELMFTEALLLRPKLIVELGVRGGASTFVFERVASLCGSTLVSVDIDDCSSISSYPKWFFVQSDDVSFARSFPQFCSARHLEPRIDLLFIDTSHYYEHTVQEIEAWFPLLSDRAKVIFHDTNLNVIGPRHDGCYELSWDNQRGVIRAIEEHLGAAIDEHHKVCDLVSSRLVRHWPHCNGLTILDTV
jgi:cephalosporin hydroxylase